MFLSTAMYRYAVVGKKGVENWAQNTALWYASVQGEDGGVVIVNPNRLWFSCREGLMQRSVSLEISSDGIIQY